MGLSTSTTHMIFFVAAVLISASMVGIFVKSISSVSDSIDSRSDRIYNEFRTEILIINDPNNIPNNPLKIYVKNIGESTLDQNLLTVLVDGEPKSNLTFNMTNDEEFMETNSVLEIIVNGTNLTTGDHSLKVITDNGASDRLDFRL